MQTTNACHLDCQRRTQATQLSEHNLLFLLSAKRETRILFCVFSFVEHCWLAIQWMVVVAFIDIRTEADLRYTHTHVCCSNGAWINRKNVDVVLKLRNEHGRRAFCMSISHAAAATHWDWIERNYLILIKIGERAQVCLCVYGLRRVAVRLIHIRCG